MESGKKAVVIIIIAMLLTAGVGFLFNFDKKPTTKTEYTPIGNMDALISANSERTQESELYNSTYNITNWNTYNSETQEWIPSAGIVRLPEGQANNYIITDEYITSVDSDYTFSLATHGYTTHVQTNYNMSIGGQPSDSEINNYNGFLTSNGSMRFWPQNSTSLKIGTSATDTSGGALMGGYGQLEKARYLHMGVSPYNVDRYTYLQYNFNNSMITYADSNFVSFVPLSAVINMNNVVTDANRNDRFEVTTTMSGVQFYGDPTITANMQVGNIQPDFDIDGEKRIDTLTVNISATTQLNFKFLRYDVGSHTWTAYDSSNTRIGDYREVYAISVNPNILNYTYKLTQYHVVPPTYADPTKYVSINSQTIWTNYNKDLNDMSVEPTTFVNTVVSILVKGTGSIDIGGVADNLTSYIQNAVVISKTGNSYVVNGVTVGNYLGLKITLSALTNQLTVEGIITDNSPVADGGSGGANTPTYTYTLSGIKVTVSHTSYTIPDMYRLRFNPVTDMKAYIQETYILSDPNQVLWKDIDINLGEYFPDDKTKLRLLLQGFVRYGDKIYLNGNTEGYTVTDGKFTISQSEGESAKTTTFILNGTAIDYYGGHTYVVQTNGKAKVDLGETQSYVVRMTGVWYFSTTASQIDVYNTEEHVWTPGWMMDMDTTILTFIGVIFMSMVIMGMRFREEMELIDMIVLILTMLIAGSLLVIT